MTLTQTQGQALATAVAKLRPDWDQSGILAALAKAANLGTPFQIARALVNLAENPDLRTPAILAQPGSHWRNPDGSTSHRRGDNDVRCIEHPSSFMPCPQCEAKRTPPPADDPEYAAMKAALKGRRGPMPNTDTRDKLTPTEELARARAALDRSAR